jgi:hypothetical protein
MENRVKMVQNIFSDEEFEELNDKDRDGWQGYYFQMTYEIVTHESAEVGEFEDTGWINEHSDSYTILSDLLRNVSDHCWVEWSSSNRDKNSWLISDGEEDYITGDTTSYCLWVHRVDGKELTQQEYEYIEEVLYIRK